MIGIWLLIIANLLLHLRLLHCFIDFNRKSFGIFYFHSIFVKNGQLLIKKYKIGSEKFIKCYFYKLIYKQKTQPHVFNF